MKNGRIAVLLLLWTASSACAWGADRGDPTAAAAGADSIRMIAVGGVERSYILHAPSWLDAASPAPVVLVFHGGGGNAENAVRMTGFNAQADRAGFIAVYPNGSGRLDDAILTWNGGACCGYAQQNDGDDVAFVRAIVADLKTVAELDEKRIYATGMSNGAIFSYRLACDASDLIAAIGPVSGTLNATPCAPKEPVSVIHFHGTADQHVPYDGGVGDLSLTGTDFTSVADSIRFWAAIDECTGKPATEESAGFRHDAYGSCRQESAVEAYTIFGGAHAWPGGSGAGWMGGDAPSQVLSATQLIWDFFTAHPKK